MSKVLFETSYIGSPGVWFSTISFFVFLILAFFKFRKDNTIEKDNRIIITASIITIMIMCTIFMIIKYTDTTVRYKSENYVEIEGVVQDYSSNLGSTRGPVESFTLDGVKFVCSDDITWGYRPSRKNGGVIAGNGQHLRIRYIPNTQGNTIVYIEQIMLEEAQQEEEIKEPAVPIDQIGIQGRTEDETELIRKIFSQDKKEFQSFLMADGVFPYKEAIRISAYDLTGDGRDEILVSKYYVDMSAELTYHYVYDQTGRRVLEFVGGGDTRIIDGWDGDGTFLLYD